MRDSIGGTVILMIIMVFMVFAIAYLAYNVNYQKAFRMKNKIISIYEKHNGHCTNDSSNNCVKEILDYANEIGYDTDNNFDCGKLEYVKGSNFTGSATFASGAKQLYCVRGLEQASKDREASGSAVYDDTGKVNCYYQIVTKINIRIPIIENVIGTPALYVTGDTKVFNITGTQCP